ncbi:hypothetical protein PPERSA_01761 [Pseudocohnilembus persalinus]|uniref:Peptidase M14 domain-containing protein n=1 Tax=Pseudocohnilembus persalinus TaxID=266149 RepID=A0A0V0R1A7_PSEPJ|nr:hypothetical protein PPERSA_01761 [Pseudocohnilembus persalinus]|eukprot:KRX08300.1 hypothetical protein PPERSA_01761 [Pseudocohnilembus persalinus]
MLKRNQQLSNKNLIISDFESDTESDNDLQEQKGYQNVKNYLNVRSQIEKLNKEKFNDLQPANEIVKKEYSLEPDMLFGWVPKINNTLPIPLLFENKQVQNIIQNIIINENSPYDIIYLGYRPHNSLELHQQYSQSNQQNPVKQIQAKYFQGMNPKFKDNKQYLQFDSKFEGGNLDLAIKINSYEYELFMRSDSNTKGHTHWFNFKVSYQKKPSRFNFMDDLQQNQKKNYYHLSFQYSCMYDDDEIQFSYCVPYNYSYLEKFLNQKTEILRQKKINILQRERLCQTLSGIDIPLLTITDFNSEKSIPLNTRKLIIMQARIHPGEANGSWLMHGVLEKLLDEQYNNSYEARKFLQKCIFKIIPMLNIDGVIMGNYRTGLQGRDLNRQFQSENKLLFPSVIQLKKFINEQIHIFKKVEMFLDFHGHSVKKNIFSYAPQFSIWDINYYNSRLLPKLLNDCKQGMFRFHSSIFKISQGKKSTARAVFHYKYGINNCYTIESSNGQYYKTLENGSLKNFDFNENDWIKMGNIFVEQIEKYLEVQCKLDPKLLEKQYELQKQQGLLQNNESNYFKQFNVQVNNLSGQSDFTSDSELEGESDIDFQNNAESDQFSEGGSDSESSDEDFDDSNKNNNQTQEVNKR